MKTPSFIKNAIYSWAVFFGTILVLSVGYAAYNLATEVPWASLTLGKWNTVTAALNDLDNRVSGISTGNIWSTSGGNLSYTGGNVGIGTTSPNYKIHILSDQNNSFSSEHYGSLGNWLRLRTGLGTIASPTAITSGSSIGGISIGGYYGGWMGEMVVGLEWVATENFTSTAQGTALLLETTLNGTTTRAERMRIDQNGNVGIGTNSPLARLAVFGSGNANNGTTTPNITGVPLFVGNTTDGIAIDSNQIERTSSTDPLYLNFNSTAPLILNYGQGSGGNVGIGTVTPGYKLDVNGAVRGASWTTISDQRFKKNITPIASGLDIVSKLQWVTFDWKHESFPDRNFPAGRQIGFIAQDVEKVLPELVTSDGEGYKWVQYANITAILVEAVKELEKENIELKKRLDALENTK